MDGKSIDIQVVADLFLLLIGIGPKIALVPFLEMTEGLDGATKTRVVRKMLATAAVLAAVLIILGEVLRKLLHFSTGFEPLHPQRVMQIHAEASIFFF